MNPQTLELCRLLERAVKQRSRLNAILAAEGANDEARVIEEGIITAVSRCRQLMDEITDWWTLPHHTPPF